MNMRPSVHLSIFISLLICQSFLCKAETDTKDAKTKITNLDEKTSEFEEKTLKLDETQPELEERSSKLAEELFYWSEAFL